MNDRIFCPEGGLLNSAKNKEYQRSISSLEEAMENEVILEARASLSNENFDLIVDLGVCRGIIPNSECAYCEDGKPPRDIAVITRVGKSVAFIVEKIIKKDGEYIAMLSRKKAQEKCICEYLNYLETGDVIDARVTHFEPFGAFCDIGCGIVSLMSIDSISVSRIQNPEDRFHIMENIKAVVKGREEPMTKNSISRGRISISHKELLGTWLENASRFSIGQTVAGIVRSIENYGIFVELAPNLAGLAEYKSGVEVGEVASVYIKNIIPEKKKVKLVLVDSCKGDRHFMKNEYFIKSGNVADWVY